MSDRPAATGYIHPELYTIEGDATRALVYAPLQGIAMLVSPSAVRWIEELRATCRWDVDAGGDVARHLESLALLRGEPFPESEPTLSDARPFAPTCATLFVTSSCNLRCVYCYSRGGERPRTMAFDVARDAVELVVANAVQAGATQATVGFHGGGEPTLMRGLISRVVDYGRACAGRAGIDIRFTLGTNGVVGDADARWIATALDSATLSIDGPPAIQDRQRPALHGRPSSAAVLRTMRIFDEAGFSYQLRATITAESCALLPEIAGYCARHSTARRLRAEPVFVVGRAEDAALTPPPPDQFVDAFCRAAAVAQSLGLELTYSGIRVDVVTDRFCGTAGGLVGVTPEGKVSACYEVTEAEDPRAGHFFFGEHIAGEGFRFDHDRIRSLRRLAVQNAPECRRCFARWHCAGDCPAKVLLAASQNQSGPNRRSWRCEITRELTRRRVMALAIGAENLLSPAP